MISQLQLRNFKCFDNVSVDLAPMTLLAGTNGSGKSSVLQSLLMLRQSSEQGILDSGLALNGNLVRMGLGVDVLWEGAGTDETIGIEVHWRDGLEATWTAAYARGAEVLDLTQQRTNVPATTNATALFLDTFQYLRAERLGPRVQSVMSGSAIHKRRLGHDGEFAPHFLEVYGAQPVPNDARVPHGSGGAPSLKEQVESWLSKMCPGIHIESQLFPTMDLVSVRFTLPFREGLTSSAYRATNIGFGVSYVLGVLVALLAAERGALIIVENPEAHLHPRAQSAMGELLALTAASGVQVLAETHSDHVLNGIRRSVHDGRVKPEDVALVFVERDGSSGSSDVVQPTLDRRGRIDVWPEGFFDEWDRGLEALLADPEDDPS